MTHVLEVSVEGVSDEEGVPLEAPEQLQHLPLHIPQRRLDILHHTNRDKKKGGVSRDRELREIGVAFEPQDVVIDPYPPQG